MSKGQKLNFWDYINWTPIDTKKEIKELGFDPANQKMVKGEEIP